MERTGLPRPAISAGHYGRRDARFNGHEPDFVPTAYVLRSHALQVVTNSCRSARPTTPRGRRPPMTDDCGPILIADGDRASRRQLRRLLEGVGYAVVEASTGRDALVLADEHRPALVLLAVQLPTLCGYDVCRRLR